MASDRNITITLRAKNAMAAGMADAKAGITGFKKAVRGVTSSLLGPIAGMTAAFMLLRKAVSAWSEVLNAGKVAGAEQSVRMLKDAVDGLKKSYAELATAIEDSNDKIKNGLDLADKQLKAARDLADATRKLAKEKAIAAIDPADTEGRKAAATQFENLDQATEAARKVKDLREEQERLAAASRKAADDADKLAVAYDRQTLKMGTALRTASDVAAAAKSGTGTMKAVVIGTEGMEGMTAMAAAAAKSVDDLRAMRAQTLKDQRTALNEAVRLDRESAALRVQVAAAEIEQKATTIEQGNKAAEDAAAKHAAAMKIIDDKAKKDRETQIKELEANEKKMAAEIKAREIEAMQDRLKDLQDGAAKAKAIGEKRVSDVIDEARQKKDNAEAEKREDEKGFKLEADMLKRGFKLSKKDQEFLAAWRERELNQLNAPILAAQAMDLQKDIKAAQEGSLGALGELKIEYAKTTELLKTLLPLG